MLLFPAIDLLDGKCVRLTLGDFAQQTTYADDPVEVAKRFEAAGARWLHVVDLDGAKSGSPCQTRVVEQIVRSVSIPVQIGGGLTSVASVEDTIGIGVSRVILGSILLKNPDLAVNLIAAHGDKVVAGIDARDGFVSVSGWLEGSHVRAVDMARSLESVGCRRIIFTDISRDGTLAGPNIEALREMLAAVEIPVIASGGVSAPADLDALAALNPAPEGVILGKSLYEGRIDLAQYGGVYPS